MTKISPTRRMLLKLALLTSFTAPFHKAMGIGSAGIGSTGIGSTGIGSAGKSLAGKKIIIIGAGISGLAAARKLQGNGAQIILLEAKPHHGGRLLTDYGLGAPFEVGAGWVHGSSAANPMAQLAKQINAETFVTDDDNLTIFDDDGEELDDEERELIDKNWWKLLTFIDSELAANDPRSLYEAINSLAPEALDDEGVVWALSAYTEFSKGGGLKDISALYHERGQVFKGRDVILKNGYDKILAPLVKNLNIQYSTIVTDINYADDQVIIHTKKADYTADFVVCSLPLGVLKANKVSFAPALPSSYREAIERLGFGSVTKIALKFKTAFWDVETQYFGLQNELKTHQTGRWNYWLNYRTFSNQNILLGISVGQYAFTVDKMSDAEMQQDALDILRNVWGDDVTKPTQMRATHWSQDPFTQGAYSFVKAGSGPQDFATLAQPIADKLFIVGEHTTFEYVGTVHGAYLSGVRAADQILGL